MGPQLGWGRGGWDTELEPPPCTCPEAFVTLRMRVSEGNPSAKGSTSYPWAVPPGLSNLRMVSPGSISGSSAREVLPPPLQRLPQGEEEGPGLAGWEARGTPSGPADGAQTQHWHVWLSR